MKQDVKRTLQRMTRAARTDAGLVKALRRYVLMLAEALERRDAELTRLHLLEKRANEAQASLSHARAQRDQLQERLNAANERAWDWQERQDAEIRGLRARLERRGK